jgi:hypothetical protein
MENKVTKSCKRKFLIPEILDKPLELHSSAVFVRWDMTVQDRGKENLGEENEVRGTLVGNRFRKGQVKGKLLGKLEKIQINK